MIQGLFGQNRVPADPGSWLMGANRPADDYYGDYDKVTVIFFEVENTVTDTLFFGINDPGMDQSDYTENAATNGAEDGDTWFRVYGGSEVYSSASRALVFSAPSTACSGTLLDELEILQADARNPEYLDQWVYLGGISPAQGELIGNKYYFKLVVVSGRYDNGTNTDASDDFLNRYQVGISTSPSGNPVLNMNATGKVRAFAYCLPIAMYTGSQFDFYPFLSNTATSGYVFMESFDADNRSGNSYSQYSSFLGWKWNGTTETGPTIMNVSGEKVRTVGDGFAPPGSYGIQISGDDTGLTWHFQANDGAETGETYNGADVWFSLNPDNTIDGITNQLTIDSDAQVLRFYFEEYDAPDDVSVSLSLVDGFAKTDGSDYEEISIQIVDRDGNPVPYSRELYIAVDDNEGGDAEISEYTDADHSIWTSVSSTGMPIITDDAGSAKVRVIRNTGTMTGDSDDVYVRIYGNGSDSPGASDYSYSSGVDVYEDSKTIVFSDSLPPTISSPSNQGIGWGETVNMPQITITVPDNNYLDSGNLILTIPDGNLATFIDRSGTLSIDVSAASGVLGTVVYTDSTTYTIPITTPFVAGDVIKIGPLNPDSSSLGITAGSTDEGSFQLNLAWTGTKAGNTNDDKYISVFDRIPVFSSSGNSDIAFDTDPYNLPQISITTPQSGSINSGDTLWIRIPPNVTNASFLDRSGNENVNVTGSGALGAVNWVNASTLSISCTADFAADDIATIGPATPGATSVGVSAGSLAAESFQLEFSRDSTNGSDGTWIKDDKLITLYDGFLYYWIGNIDTDWDTVTNWNPQTQAPPGINNTQSALILNGTYDPTLDLPSADYSIKNLTIQAGATLTVNGAYNFNVINLEVESGASFELTGGAVLNVSGSITGGGTINGSVNFTQDPLKLTGNCTFGSDITFLNPVKLTGNTSISAPNITFGSTIDGDNSGSYSLTLNAGNNLIFSGNVGQNDPLAGVNATASTKINLGGNWSAEGNTLIFNSPVILTSDTVVNDSGGGIRFLDTVDSDGATPWDLSVTASDAASQIRFAGIVGGNNSLDVLTIANTNTASLEAAVTADGGINQTGAGTVTISGSPLTTANTGISFNGPVTLGSDITLDSGNALGDIIFNNTISGGDSYSLSVDAGSGAFALNGDASGLTSFTLDDGSGGAGASTVDMTDITLTSLGNISLISSGNIQLGHLNAPGQTIKVESTGGAISDNLTGETANITSNNLTLISDSGIGTADDINTTITTLTLADTNTGGIYLTESNGIVLTSLDSSNTQVTIAVTLGNLELDTISSGTANMSLTATAGQILDASIAETANITASGLTLSASTGIGTSGANADINTTISSNLTKASTGSGGIYLTDSGSLELGADDVNSGSGPLVLSAVGNITDSNGDSLLTSGGIITLSAGGGIGATGQPVLMDYTAGNAVNVTTGGTGTAGDIYLDETSGNLELVDFDFTTKSDGTILENTQSVILSNSSGTIIHANTSPSESGDNLTLTSGSGIQLSGTLTVDEGTLTLDGPVLLTGNTILDTYTSSGGGIDFNSTVTGSVADTQTLTLIAGSGAVSFDGAVGAVPLGAVDIQSCGTLDFSSTFSASSLTTVQSGDFTIGGLVNLSSGAFDENGTGGNVDLNAGISTTDMDITFTRPVVLGAGITLDSDSSTGAGSIRFDNTISGAGSYSLTLEADEGNITLNGNTTGLTGFTVTNGALLDCTDISLTSSGAVDIDTSGNIQLGILSAAGQNVFLTTSTGAISDNWTADESPNIVCGTLVLEASTGIGASGANADINTTISSNLTKASTGSGGIYLTNSGSLELGADDVNSGSGPLVLSAVGNITDSNGDSLLTSGGITTLSAGGGIGATGQPVLMDYTAGNAVNVTTGGTGTAGDIYLDETSGNLELVDFDFTTKSDGTTLENTQSVILSNSSGTILHANTSPGESGDNLTLTSGSGIQLSGTLTVDEGTLTLDGPVLLTGNTILDTYTSSGGGIDFNSTITGSVANAQTLTLIAGSGAVSFDGAVGAVSLGAVDIQSCGTLDFSSTFSASSLTTAQSGDFTIGGLVNLSSGAFDENGTGGNVNLNAGISTADMDITFTRPVVLGAGITLDSDSSTGAGSIQFDNTISGVGSYSLTLEADEGNITLNGNTTGLTGFTVTNGALLDCTDISLTSSGAVDIDTSGNIQLGILSAAGQNVFLTTSTGAISDNWTADESANIVCGTLVLEASTGIGASGANADINTTISSNLTKASTGSGGIYLTDSGSLELGADDVNSGSGPLVLSAVGNITDSNGDSLLTSGGITTLSAGGGIGATGQPVLMDYTAGNAVNVTTGGTGTAGDIYLDETSGNLELVDFDFTTKSDGTTLENTQSVILSNSSGTILHANTSPGESGDNLTLTSSSGIELSGTLTVDEGTLTLDGPVLLTGNTILDTYTSSGGGIDFNSTVTGSVADTQTLTLIAGSGAVSFDGAVGAVSLGAVSITSSGAVTQNSTFVAKSLNVDHDGIYRINGNVTLTDTFVESSTGLSGTVELNGNITTGTDSITFNRPVSLINGITLSTGAGGAGNIDFNNTLNGSQSLALTAGSGNIYFDLAVGGSNRLGAVTVNSSAIVTQSSTFTAASLNVDHNGVYTITDAVDLTGSFVESSTGGTGSVNLNNDITTSAANITFNRPVTMGDAIALSTGGGANIGNISFGTGSTINCDSHTLALTAGTGNIILSNEDVSNCAGLTVNSAADFSNSEKTIGLNSSCNVDINVSGAVQLGVINASGGTIDINTSGGSISDNLTGETANISCTTLILEAATGIGSTDEIDIIASSLSFYNTGTGAMRIANIPTANTEIHRMEQAETPTSQEINYIQTGNYSLDLDNDSGNIGTNGADITIILEDSDSDITISGDIDSDGGNISISKTENIGTSSGRIIINNGINIYSGTPSLIDGGNITISNPFGELVHNGSIDTSDGSGGGFSGSGQLSISGSLVLGKGDISLTGDDSGDYSLTLNSAVSSSDPAGISFTSRGDILVNNDIYASAGNLVLEADSDNNGSGGIQVNTANGRLRSGAGITLSGSDLISVGTATGDSIVVQSISQGIDAVGTLNISTKTAGASHSAFDLFLESVINCGNAVITANDDIFMEATNADLTADTGTIQITAGNVSSDGRIVQASGSRIFSDTAGNITLNADTGIVLGEVNAGSSNLSLNCPNGSISDVSTDTTADLIGNNIIITVGLSGSGGIGASGNPVDLTCSGVLTSNTSGSDGNQYLYSTAALAIDELLAGNGDISLRSAGSIIDNDDSTVDISANNITLVSLLTSGTGIGAAGTAPGDVDTLEVYAISSINASSSNSDIFLFNDGTHNFNTDTIDAGTGNIAIRTTGTGSIVDVSSAETANFSGANLTLSSVGSLGASGASGDLDTAVSSITASAAAGIYLSETDNLQIDSINAGADEIILVCGGSITDVANDTTADLTAADISLTAGVAGIGTAANLVDLSCSGELTSNTSAAGGDQYLYSSGNLEICTVNAGSGDVKILLAGGSLTDSDSDSLVSGNLVDFEVTGAVGTSGNRINTSASSLNLSSTSAGSLYINEANTVTLVDLDTVDGTIDILSVGTQTATDIDAAGAGQDVVLRTTGSLADISIGLITSADAVTLTSDLGGILDATSGNDNVTDISAAGNITITAETGIGNLVDATPFDDLTATDFLEFKVSGATITLNGNGEIAIQDIESGNDLSFSDINHTGNAVVWLRDLHDNLTLSNSDFSSTDRVALTADAGNITIPSEITAQELRLDANNTGKSVNDGDPVAGNTDLNINATTLSLTSDTATTITGELGTLLNIEVNGSLAINDETGDLTVDLVSTGGPSPLILDSTGSIYGAGNGNSVTASDLIVRSQSGAIGTSSTTLDIIAATLAAQASGGIYINETNALSVSEGTIGVDTIAGISSSGGGVTYTGGAALTIDKKISSAVNGAVSINASPVILAINTALPDSREAITTNGGSISLSGNLVLNESGNTINSVNSSGADGNISIGGTLTSQAGEGNSINLVSDTGNITFNGQIGAPDNTRIGDFSIASSKDVTLNGAVYADNLALTSSGHFDLNGAVDLDGNLTHTPSGGSGSITIAGDILTRDGSVIFGFPVVLDMGGDTFSLNTVSSGGGAVDFKSSLSGDKSISLNSGTAPVTFRGNIGGASLTPLKSFTVNASHLYLENSISAASSGNWTINCPIDATSSGGGGLDLILTNYADLYFQEIMGAVNPLSAFSVAADSVNDDATEYSELEIYSIGSDSQAGVNGAVSLSAKGKILFDGVYYRSGGAQSISVGNPGLRIFLSGDGGNWDAGANEIMVNGPVFLDYDPNTLILNSFVKTGQLVFYGGTLNLNGKTLASSQQGGKDLVVFGSDYNASDSDRADTSNEWAYPSYEELAYKPADETFNAVFSDLISATLQSGNNDTGTGNLYVNGTKLEGSGEWNIITQNNNQAASDETSEHLENSLFISHFNTVFNSSVSNSLASGGNIAAAVPISDDSYTEGAENEINNNVINGGGNTEYNPEESINGWDFTRPYLVRAQSVYDNVILFTFNEAIENSHNEISSLVNSVFTAENTIKGLESYAEFDSFTGEGISSDGKGDLSAFYIRFDTTWNTDAHNKLLGGGESTDISGTHREIIPDLSLLKGLFLDAGGHNLVRNYGNNDKSRFESTEDFCRPAVWKIDINRAEPKESGLPPEIYPDGHNYFEIYYSEPVDIGTMNDGDYNIRSTSTFSEETQQGGDITSSSGKAAVSGYFTYGSDSSPMNIKRGSRDSEGLEAGTANALWKTSSYRQLIFLSGYYDGKNWLGYHWDVTSPENLKDNNLSILANELIKDRAASPNILNHVPAPVNFTARANSWNPEGKIWDVDEPLFAPYIPSSGDTGAYEILARNLTIELYIDRLEIHILDNGSDVENWNSDTGNPDLASGQYGIRDNSLTSTRFPLAEDAFQLQYAGGNGGVQNLPDVSFYSGVQNVIFDPVNKPPELLFYEDDPYFSLSYNDKELQFNLKSNLELVYNKEIGFITDKAGNLLDDIQSPMLLIERIPPEFSYTLTVSDKNRIFVRFTEPVFGKNKSGFQDEIKASDFHVLNPETPWEFYKPESIELLETEDFDPESDTNPLGAEEVFLDFADNFSADQTIEWRIRPSDGFSVSDHLGNFMESDEQNPLTDIGLGVVYPLWASDGIHDDLQAGVNSGALRIFDGTGRLLPNDVQLQSYTEAINQRGRALSLYFDIDPDENVMADGFWLPDYFPDLIPKANNSAREIESYRQSGSNGELNDFYIDESDTEIEKDSEFQFIMKLGNLYCARAINPDDPRTLAPWSFYFDTIKRQKGGVTILNNIINPLEGDKAMVNYVLENPGFVSVQVFALDGGLVKVLFRGKQGVGEYTYSWDGRNDSGNAVARGVYFLRVMAPEIDETRKILVEK